MGHTSTKKRKYRGKQKAWQHKPQIDQVKKKPDGDQ